MKIIGCNVCFHELVYMWSLYLRGGHVNFSCEGMGVPL